MPDEKEGVMRMLEKQHATSRNVISSKTPPRCKPRSIPPGNPQCPIPSSSLPTVKSSTKIWKRGPARTAAHHSREPTLRLYRLQSILADRFHSKGLREKRRSGARLRSAALAFSISGRASTAFVSAGPADAVIRSIFFSSSRNPREYGCLWFADLPDQNRQIVDFG